MANLEQATRLEQATLGGGCFWCLEAVYTELQGVAEVKSGYAGGPLDYPNYKQVCSGTTGHAEVVRVDFDPSVVSYADLLRIFFTIHDPTTPNRQGNDMGTQYRSIILTENDEQARIAPEIFREISEAKLWPYPLVTQIEALERFWPAEPEHHRYFERNPWTGYCAAIVAPKVVKFRKQFASRLKSKA